VFTAGDFHSKWKWELLTAEMQEKGFGAGMGLPNAKRVSDEFEMQSGIEMGTMVKAIVFLGRGDTT